MGKLWRKDLVKVLFSFFVLSTNFLLTAQESDLFKGEKNDGPYLFYQGNTVKIVNANYGFNHLYFDIDSFDIKKLEKRKIKVKPNSSLPAFHFNLFKFKADSAVHASAEKLLLVSDIEGNLEDFVRILITAGVINKKYEWTFGSNQLFINGDLFDRGNDVTAFLWLVYKLDGESKLAGGKVLVNLGNHDEMNLRGFTGYVVAKYLYLAQGLGIEYKKLYDENTELGRWLRTKNCITLIDSNLFVHAGLSYELLIAKLNAEEINTVIRENLGKEDSLMGPLPKFLFGNLGPLWYRGLVFNYQKYNPITSERLNIVMDYFKVKHIIVGHSIVQEIVGLHDGRVIAADVDHPENRKAGKSRALLITKNRFYTINDKGQIKDLPVVKGFNQIINEQSNY